MNDKDIIPRMRNENKWYTTLSHWDIHIYIHKRIYEIEDSLFWLNAPVSYTDRYSIGDVIEASNHR